MTFSAPDSPELNAGFSLQDWQVLPSRNLIVAHGKETRLEPKVMQVLVCLARHQGETVTRETLHQTVWPDSFVSSKTLTRTIGILRRAFSDQAQTPLFIETISKRGYRLIPPIHPLAEKAEATGQQGQVQKKRHFRLVLLIFLGLAIPIPGFIWWKNRTGPTVNQIVFTTPARAATRLVGHELRPAPSPDGSLTAFAWSGETSSDWHLYLQDEPSGSLRQFTRQPGLNVSPAWSPDGQTLAYLHFGEHESGIYLKSLDGSERRKLVDCFHPQIAQLEFVAPRLAWSPDGQFLAFPTSTQGHFPLHLSRIGVNDASQALLTKPGPETYADMDPSFSPDGRFMAFTRFKQWQTGDLWLLDLETDQETRLTDDENSILGHTWTPDSSTIVFSSNRSGSYQLWQLSLDNKQPQWIAAPGEYLKYPNLTAEAGLMSYENWHYDTNFWKVRTVGFPQAQPMSHPNSSAWDHHPRLNRLAKTMLFVSNRDGHFEIWQHHLEENIAEKLTNFRGAIPGMPRWSPDGNHLAFQLHDGGSSQCFIMDVATQSLTEMGEKRMPRTAPSWSPDGRWLYYAARQNGSWNLWRTQLESQKSEAVTQSGGYFGQVSPDQTVLYFSKLDQPGIWRKSLETGETRLLIEDCGLGDWGNWLLADIGIYYLQRGQSGSTQLSLWEFEREAVVPVATIDGWVPMHQPALSKGMNDDEFLITLIDKTEADIMLMSWPVGDSSL